MKVSARLTPGTRAHLVVHQAEQLLGALAHDLDQDVEAAGGDHHVVDLVDLGEGVGHASQVAVGVDGHHGLDGEADGQRGR